jgi:hypothetical protein
MYTNIRTTFKENDLHIHHWQYGAILACTIAMKNNTDLNVSETSIMQICTKIAAVIFHAVLIAICWHGVWSYGPDQTKQKWSYTFVICTYSCFFLFAGVYYCLYITEAEKQEVYAAALKEKHAQNSVIKAFHM